MNINEKHENRAMKRISVLVLLFAALLVPFSFAATQGEEEIALTGCTFDSGSDLACSQSVTATCDAVLTGLGDIQINDVEYTISGTTYNANLVSGTRTNGTWEYTVTANAQNKQDLSFDQTYIGISGQTTAGTRSCTASKDNANTGTTANCFLTWGSTLDVTNTCECTYTTTQVGSVDENNTVTYSRSGSAGCIDQSSTTFTDYADFCDPEWTVGYTACIDGKQTKTYTAGNTQCVQNGNDIWFNHNTGSDQTKPIDEGSTRSCTITSVEQYANDEYNSGVLNTTVVDFNKDSNDRRSISFSTKHNPLSADVDDDGRVELFAFGASNIRMYDRSGNLQGTQAVGGTISGSPALIQAAGRTGNYALIVPVRINSTAGQVQVYDVTSGSSFSLDDTLDFDDSGTAGPIPRGITCKYTPVLLTEETRCYFATVPDAGLNQSSHVSQANKVSIGDSGTSYSINQIVPPVSISAFLQGTNIFLGADWADTPDQQSTSGAPVIVEVADGDTQIVWPMTILSSGYENGMLFVTTEGLERRQRFFLYSNAFLDSSTQESYILEGAPVSSNRNNRAYIAYEEKLTGVNNDLHMGGYVIELVEDQSYSTNTNLAGQQALSLVTPTDVWLGSRSGTSEGVSNMVMLEDYNPALAVSSQTPGSSGTLQQFEVPSILYSGEASWTNQQQQDFDFRQDMIEVSEDGRFVMYTGLLGGANNGPFLRIVDLLLEQTVYNQNLGDSLNVFEQTVNIVYDAQEQALYWFTIDLYSTGTLYDAVFVEKFDVSSFSSVSSVWKSRCQQISVNPVVSGGGNGFLVNDNVVTVRGAQGGQCWFDRSDGSSVGSGTGSLDLAIGGTYNEDAVKVFAGTVDGTQVTLFSDRVVYGDIGTTLDLTNTSSINYVIPESNPVNYDTSDFRWMFYDSSNKNSYKVRMQNWDPVQQSITGTACTDFYPLYYNSDSHILGIILQVDDELSADRNAGPVLGYCDFSDEFNPQLYSYDIHVPFQGGTDNGSHTEYSVDEDFISVDNSAGSYDGTGQWKIVIGGARSGNINDTIDPVKLTTLDIDGNRLTVSSGSGAATQVIFFGRDLESSNSVYGEFAPKMKITAGDWDGDGSEDVITPVGGFLHYPGTVDSSFGPVRPGPGSGAYDEFDAGSNGIGDTVVPMDLNYDSIMDLVTVLPTQSFFTTYTSNPPANAILEGDLQINELRCSVQPDSSQATVRLLTTAPDPDSISVRIAPGDGQTGFVSRTVQTDGVYNVQYMNSGDYTITVQVRGTNAEDQKSCSITIPEQIAPSQTCDVGESGTFNYADTLQSRGWDILVGSTTVSPSGGVYSSTIGDVLYPLEDCGYEQVTVEFSALPGTNGGLYIQGASGGTAGFVFAESDGSVLNENGERITTFPTGNTFESFRFVIDSQQSLIRYFVGDQQVYTKSINDFTLGGVRINRRVTVDYVDISKIGEQTVVAGGGDGSGEQVDIGRLDGDISLLQDCDADALTENTDINQRISAPAVSSYCSTDDGGTCNILELQQIVNYNQQCSKEVYNYCVGHGQSGIARGTQCASLLTAGSTVSNIGFPIVTGVWDYVTANPIASMIILMIVVISVPIWIKRRK